MTRVLPVVLGYSAMAREAGHEPVALLSVAGGGGLTGQLDQVPPELDILLPARRSSLAPLLASVRPDIVLCTGFPWKVPADALAVPPLGWLNGHPSLLPRHRGPVPMAWTIANGDTEAGLTIHRMDAELDTGPVFAQRRFDLGEYEEPNDFYTRTGALMLAAMREALDKVAAGDEGVIQEDGGDYESFYGGDEVLWLDLNGSALDAHRRVWAWRYSMPVPGRSFGALATLDGATVRVLASSLDEVDGARRLDFADGPLWLVRTEPAEG